VYVYGICIYVCYIIVCPSYIHKEFRFFRHSIPFPSLALCLPFPRTVYFVVSLFPRRYAVAKLDETRYRIERAITASSRVGARLLTRLYVAERLNCTAQRELTPAKTASSSDAPRGRAVKNNRATRIAKKECVLLTF